MTYFHARYATIYHGPEKSVEIEASGDWGVLARWLGRLADLPVIATNANIVKGEVYAELEASEDELKIEVRSSRGTVITATMRYRDGRVEGRLSLYNVAYNMEDAVPDFVLNMLAALISAKAGLADNVFATSSVKLRGEGLERRS